MFGLIINADAQVSAPQTEGHVRFEDQRLSDRQASGESTNEKVGREKRSQMDGKVLAGAPMSYFLPSLSQLFFSAAFQSVWPPVLKKTNERFEKSHWW